MITNGKKTTIYYFSATGNSLKLALDIASVYKDAKLIKIGKSGAEYESDADRIGFIFPVYMGGLPNIVRTFIEDFPFRKGVYYFSVATYYTYKGCALPIVQHIMSEKGVSLHYANYLPSVGNCLKEYEVSSAKRKVILERSETLTKSIIANLKDHKRRDLPRYCRLSDIIHKKLFNAFFSTQCMMFSLESSCIQCGACVKICPVNNITLNNGTPEWGSACEACHACVHWCPQNAIHIGNSKGRLQYQHPSIKRSMLYHT